MTGYVHRISLWKVGSVFAIIQTRVIWGRYYWGTILHLLAIPLLSQYDNSDHQIVPPGKSVLKPSRAVGTVHSAPLVAEMVKNLPSMWDTKVRSLGREIPLKEGMATYSSILAWRSPWTEEPGGLQSLIPQSQTGLCNYQTCRHILWMLA